MAWLLPAVTRLLLLLLVATPLNAHDLWLEQGDDDFLLHYGHRPSGHSGEATIDYAPGIVKAVHCVDADGRTMETSAGTQAPVRITGPCAALHVLTSSGFWSRTIEGLRNQPASELDGVLRSWQAVEGVKHMSAWSTALATPLTGALEITPLADPFAAAPGDKLRLLVTLEGEPLPGTAVAYDSDTRGVTGRDGRINIRVRHPGVQFITASFESPRSDGQAELTIHAGTLMFELPQ